MIEAELVAKAEAERLAEEQRLEAERLAKAEAARIEAELRRGGAFGGRAAPGSERLAKAEEARLEAELVAKAEAGGWRKSSAWRPSGGQGRSSAA